MTDHNGTASLFFLRGSGIGASEIKIYRAINSRLQNGGLKKQKNELLVMRLTVQLIGKNCPFNRVNVIKNRNIS